MLAPVRNAAKDALQHLVFRDRFLWRLPGRARALALTFDDGPHPEYTPQVLDVLAQADVRATFFLVGREVEKYPLVAKRIVDEGHAVGGHSYDHTMITTLSSDALVADLRHCRDVIAAATGAHTVLFRPPRGEVSFMSIRTVCRAGYRLVHWSRTFGDYRQDGAAPLRARIEASPAVSGEILLLHDHNRYTAEVLPAAIAGWQAAGFAFALL